MSQEVPYKFEQKSINPDAFQQTTFWYDKKGNKYRVNEMSLSYLINAMNYMIKHHDKHQPVTTPLFQAMSQRASELDGGA